jgi:ferritin-like metal-binding protein YciE
VSAAIRAVPSPVIVTVGTDRFPFHFGGVANTVNLAVLLTDRSSSHGTPFAIHRTRPSTVILPLPEGNPMTIDDLNDLFVHCLKDTYDAEKRLTKALPKMAKAASSELLQSAFEEHLAVTEQHVERLERIFEMLDKPARGKKCAGIVGLVEEGAELMGEDVSGDAMDAGLIGAAQKVEHYEIAAYGTMATYADLLEMPQAAKLLRQTLAEEKEADEKLTELASTINVEAQAAAG